MIRDPNDRKSGKRNLPTPSKEVISQNITDILEDKKWEGKIPQKAMDEKIERLACLERLS